MLRSESTDSCKRNSRVLDFDLLWHSQPNHLLDNRPRSFIELPSESLFTQYDRRFDRQRQVKRSSRLPIPSTLRQQVPRSLETELEISAIPAHLRRSNSTTASASASPLLRRAHSSDRITLERPVSFQVQAAINLAKQYRHKRQEWDLQRKEEEEMTLLETVGRDGLGGPSFDGQDYEAPITSTRFPLRQTRSFVTLSDSTESACEKEEGQQEEEESSSMPPSLLRQRRCKLPLSIKTEEESLPRLKKSKSSYGSIHSPPPCPPPTTPLPEIPLSACLTRHHDRQQAKIVDDVSVLKISQRDESPARNWSQAQHITLSPTSSSSVSTSPTSSRESSDCHLSDSPSSLPLTPPSNLQAQPSMLRQQQQQSALNPNLALYLAVHLDMIDLNAVEQQRQPCKDIVVDSSEEDCNYVYGFAL